MEITWLGHACFRLRSREAAILIDPYDKSIGYNLGKPTADVVCVTHDHAGHNNIAAVAGNPRVVRGPGEYEIKRTLIVGVQTAHDQSGGKRLGKNTAYVVELDDVTVCHLGDLGHVPTAEQLEELDNVDVLLVPVGGKETLSVAQAAETISLIDPKIVVPMHYKTEATPCDLEPIDRFLKEMGIHGAEPQPKLAVTKSTLPETMQVVVLDYRRA